MAFDTKGNPLDVDGALAFIATATMVGSESIREGMEHFSAKALIDPLAKSVLIVFGNGRAFSVAVAPVAVIEVPLPDGSTGYAEEGTSPQEIAQRTAFFFPNAN